MERDLYKKLIEWKAESGRKPLIVRGARQVGKTYLLKTFAEKNYDSYLYLNFEEEPRLAELFKRELKAAALLENIGIYFETKIHPKRTLLIFDEIQASPEALNSLKYFQEQANEYHIVAAGSLLGVKLSHTKGFPVGKVNFLDLYPLNFFEFLTAINKNKLREYLESIQINDEISSLFHDELLLILKKYFYIGGMPEVVREYVRSENFASIRTIQKEILDAYTLDFVKHAPAEQVMKITQVWDSIPAQLARENKKFIFSAIKESARGREYENAIQWLSDAGLIYKSHHVSVPKLPLRGYEEKDYFKVFLLDVGLLSAMSHIPAKSILENENYFGEFQGAFTENFVAQALVEKKLLLHYWTSSFTAEVDFLIEHELQVYPLEVKADLSRKKKSLLVYNEKYKPKMMLRASLRNLKKEEKVLNIPLYMISQLINFL